MMVRDLEDSRCYTLHFTRFTLAGRVLMFDVLRRRWSRCTVALMVDSQEAGLKTPTMRE
jgi:hypothetical protein